MQFKGKYPPSFLFWAHKIAEEIELEEEIEEEPVPDTEITVA